MSTISFTWFSFFQNENYYHITVKCPILWDFPLLYGRDMLQLHNVSILVAAMNVMYLATPKIIFVTDGIILLSHEY